MAYTRHGYHIPNTKIDARRAAGPVAKCGGIKVCVQCKDEISIHESMCGSHEDYQQKAKDLVTRFYPDEKDFAVFVVWWTKVLKNWKAMVSTTVADGRYYEVTHDGSKNLTHITVYKKESNVTIPDAH